MDCLDRTNVVQSVLSRKILHQQLFELQQSGKPTGEPFQPFSVELEQTFRDLWTDHADTLSILYSGTPALKTDFTRTGKRTRYGAISDFKHSARRYYLNNFCDGYNHDCLDMSQKKLTPTCALVKRSWLSAFKVTILGLAGTFYAASLVLATYMPLPELLPGGEDIGNYD